MKTWGDFMETFAPHLSEEVREIFLWEWTAFPMADIKTITRQYRSAIRAHRNQIKRCEMCGWKEPNHQAYCLNATCASGEC